MAKRILGVDFGLKRLGLAVSDPTQLIATPLTTLQAEKKGDKTALKLKKFLRKYLNYCYGQCPTKEYQHRF